jgi:hypothetical protein
VIKRILKNPIFLVFLFLSLIILLIFWFTQRGQSLEVAQTMPPDKEESVLVTVDVFIVFTRNIEQEEQSLININISPEIEYAGHWTDNQFRISPVDSWEKETQYEIKVSFKDNIIHTFSFKTAPFTLEQIEEEGQLQSQDDLQFGERYESFIEQYPWYIYMPIETFDYRVVYDFEENSFRIRVKIPVETDEQEQEIVEKALESLREIGVPEPISYYTLK